VSYTLWEEIFAEFNFADFCPTREIKFRENSLKKGSKWERNEGERVKMGKISI